MRHHQRLRMPYFMFWNESSLEAANYLNTSTFLAAVSRLIARRGCSKNIYSYNGTNFVGASKALKTEFKEFLKESQTAVISKYFYQERSWHFIPASAPHMGGLWEAGVKSFNSHSRKIASGLIYIFEELFTLLCRIESCLNSGLLSPASNNPSYLEPRYPRTRLLLTNRWQKMKILHQLFCVHGKNNYLKELQKRTKWKHHQPNRSRWLSRSIGWKFSSKRMMTLTSRQGSSRQR